MVMHDIRATFSKGEVTPLVHSREDLQLYKTSLAAVRNFTVLKQGGLRRRSGTRYYGAAKTTGTEELLPFAFNDSQAYALEFGNLFIRFLKDTGQVLSGPSTPYEIVSPYTSAQVSRVQWAQSNDVIYLAYPDVKPKQLNRFSDTNWTITDVAFQDGPYLPVNDSANTVNWTTLPVQGASVTFTHAATTNINGGIGFVSTDVGRHYRIQTLGVWVWCIITAVTNSTTIVATVQNSSILASPVGVDHYSLLSGLGYFEVAGNTVQETAKDAGGAATTHGFKASDIGKVFPAFKIMNSNTEDAYVRLTRICSDQTIEFVIIGKVHAGTTNSASFQLGAFSDTTGYPGSVAFFNGRLCWGRTKSNPRGVALSCTGTPTLYAPTARDGTVTDNLGMFVDVTAGKSDEFGWLADGARLLIGSPSSIRSLGSSDPNAGLTPKNVTAKLEVPVGSTPVLPVQIGPNTFTTKRFGVGMTNLAYDYQAGGIIGPDQSILSEHLFHTGTRRMAYTESPEGVVWSLTNDGTLVGMTYDRYEQVVGFHKHPMQNGIVTSIVSIPSATYNRDMLFMLVQRTVNGSTVQYVEVLEKPFYNDVKANAFFVDCGGTYSGAPTNVVTGLDFLEGQTVAVLADGALLPQAVVTGGQITLADGILASTVQVGIPIAAFFTLLPLAVATQEGNQRGLEKRIPYAILDMYESMGGQVGIDGDAIDDDINRRDLSDPMDTSPPLFTGTRKVAVEDTWDSPSQLTVICNDPLPMTVRAINIGIEARP